jgi:hypothetical protein
MYFGISIVHCESNYRSDVSEEAELQFSLLSFRCVKLGPSHRWRNIDWVYSSTGRWSRHIGLRGSVGDCTRNFIRVIKSRRMTWAGHVAPLADGRGAYRVLVGKCNWMRPLGSPKHRWEGNIKTDLEDLAQGRSRWRPVVCTVMKLRVTSSAGVFLTSWEPVSLSRRTLLRGVMSVPSVYLSNAIYIGQLCISREPRHIARDISFFK